MRKRFVIVLMNGLKMITFVPVMALVTLFSFPYYIIFGVDLTELYLDWIVEDF